jgi:hypothetical protein
MVGAARTAARFSLADDGGVVDEAVDHRFSPGRIAEHLAPAAERLVGGHDHRRPPIAGRRELDDEVGSLGLERDVTDLVDVEGRMAPQVDELGLEAALAVGGRGKVDPVAGLAGPLGQPDRDVGSSRCQGARGRRRCGGLRRGRGLRDGR